MNKIVINYGWLVGMLFCMIAMRMQAVVVHVVPIWYDNQANAWQILVGRNIGTATWSDFDSTGTDEPFVLAQATLKSYTRGRYSEKNAPIVGALHLVLYGQHFFFVPVLDKVNEGAMRKARNSQKTEFTWVSVQQVIGFAPVYDPRKRKSGRISVDVNFRAVMRLFWPEIDKMLHMPKKDVVRTKKITG